MSATGEHAAVPNPEPLLEERTRKTLSDVRILLGVAAFFIVTMFGGGWAAMAQVRDEAKDAAKTETAGITTEQAALKANVRDLREEVADVKAEVRELRKDLRLLFPKLPATDAGR